MDGGGNYGSNANPISLQKYLYAGANPVNAYDPSGHDLIEILATIGLDNVVSGISDGFAARAAIGATTNLVTNFIIAEATSQNYTVSQGVYDFLSGGLIGGVTGGIGNVLESALSDAGWSAALQIIGSKAGEAIVGAIGSTLSSIARTEEFTGQLPSANDMLKTFGFSLVGTFLGGTLGKTLEGVFPEDIAEAAQNAENAYQAFLQRSQILDSDGLKAAAAVLEEAYPYAKSVAGYIVNNSNAVGQALGKGLEAGFDVIGDLLKDLVYNSPEGG